MKLEGLGFLRISLPKAINKFKICPFLKPGGGGKHLIRWDKSDA